MPTTPPSVSTIPDPPSRADPANFASRGDGFLGAFPTMRTEFQALATNVFNNATEANAAASDALVSKNSATTNANTVASSVSAAAAFAASAQAAAAATQAGLPAQTSTDGLLLRSDQGVASWATMLGPARHVAYSATSQNEISNSGATQRSGWTASGITFTLGSGGPNGCGFNIVALPSGFATIAWGFTPVQGVTRTASCWWRGNSKPAAGSLISMQYRDISNVQQSVSLDFTSSTIIADGKWRRYSVSATHAGSTVTSQTLFFFPNSGAFTSDFADPQLNTGETPTTYVCTGATVLLHPRNSYHIDTNNGSITAFLLDSQAISYDWIHIKDIARSARTYPIVLSTSGTALLENLAENIDINVTGASVTIVRRFFPGWSLV